MLFDLKGKRRRTVQGVYVTLAVLMGAGLVLFGIGSSVNGGLFDAFSGGSGSSKANETVQKRIDAAEKTLQRDPNNAAALAAIMRGHYDLATANSDPNTGDVGKASFTDLQAADAAWARYLTAVKQPDADVARVAVQAEPGLAQLITNQDDAKVHWARAAAAQEVLAAAESNPNAYVNLAAFATLAGQTRKADLAGKKAIELAPKAQKKDAKAAVAQAKTNPLGQGQGAQPAPGQ
jgi:tetratricopeptide (TPR) repeat protein